MKHNTAAEYSCGEEQKKKKKSGGWVEREVGGSMGCWGEEGGGQGLFSVEREPAMFFHSLEGLLKCVSET